MKGRRAGTVITLICAAALLCVPTGHAADTVPVVYASLPWLSGIARFIVGTTIKVQSASVWNSSGNLVAPRAKPPADASVIALDPKDAGRLDFKDKAPNLQLLYDNLPIEESKRGYMPFNPSILPFLSQRLLIVLCKLNPENYSFYQRRLAEFQSRMESSVEVGKSLIDNLPVLDLSGAVGPWIRAASSKAVRPPDELWNAWSANARMTDLSLAIQEAENNGWWILTDVWTPRQIREKTASSARLVSISPPEADYDFFDYLHNIYLKIWTASSVK